MKARTITAISIIMAAAACSQVPSACFLSGQYLLVAVIKIIIWNKTSKEWSSCRLSG